MMKPKTAVDGAETHDRIAAPIRNESSTACAAGAFSASTPPGSTVEQHDNTLRTNGAATSYTKPTDSPLRKHSYSTTPVHHGPSSPEAHLTASPDIRGLRPPQNTPKTTPTSPHISPNRTYDDELADVSHAFSTIVGTFDTRLLEQSMWAPKASEYQPSSLSEVRTPSRCLTPVKIVEANPSINDYFTRMSFRAADSDHGVGNALIGDHLVKPSTGKPEQSKISLFNGEKLKAALAPMSDRGSVPTLHSTTNDSPVPEANVSKVRFEASPSSGSTDRYKGPTSNDLAGDQFAATSLPSRMRATSHAPHATGKPTITQAKCPENMPSKLVTPTECSSAGSVKNTSASNSTIQATIPTTAAGIRPHSEPSPALGFCDKLVATRQQLNSTGDLEADDSALRADLTSQILRRTANTESSETSKSTDKTEEMNLPSSFVDKWAAKPKNKKENYIASTTATGALTTSAKPAAINAALWEPTKPSTRPPLVSKAANVAAKSGKDLEDRESKTFFNGWPQLEQRGRPAARIRTLLIKDIPRAAPASFIASIVYGGPIEEIHMRETSATVRFISAIDCQKYYDDTSNGVVYGTDDRGRELVAFVELGKDVDVIGGLLRGWIDTGVTRCVKAVGVDGDIGVEALRGLGDGKGRKLEGLEDGKTIGGTRSVVWRFCKIDEAVQFKAALHRDEEWEHCNIHYATDPCARATEVRQN